ncbi:MAG: B12-binding domain-containing radical SAM protein [Anaerovoracaceae bacterium]|jgi:radical SAM superfamily enzyme YgiQ (UPF0313 family)
MKIVFITPTTRIKRLGIYRAAGKIYGQPNSITGPLILGGILKRAGHDVEVYEELNGPVPMKRLLKDTDVFCFCIMSSNAPRAYELADEIRKSSNARILMGGFHASALPEEALEHADQVLCGEGEKVILDVVEGRVTDSIVRCEPIPDLDEVPFPDYSILKTPVVSANVLSTRGCPFRCTFCTTSRMFDPYRQRSVDNVIEEIRMYKQMGFRYMNFEDDNFTADKERAKEICRRMIAEDLTFKETFFFGRTDMANDEELLRLLSEAHLTRVLIGIESLNQDALDAVNKGQSINDIKRACRACAEHGIRVIASIVLGLDQDRKEDIRRSVEFTKSINAYQLQPAILTPYPGTPVYKEMEEDGRLIDHDWEKYDMMNVTFQPKNMSPWDLQEEFYRATKHFYDFKSVKYIRALFGNEYAGRRLGLAMVTRLGTVGAHAASHVKNSIYYQIRNTDWIYAPEKPEDKTAGIGTEPEADCPV